MADDWTADVEALRARRPGHILFLCVANSSRSQMAEGIARALSPPGVRISSAGSAPRAVRPEAITVLEEIGVDISTARSKGVDEIDTRDVDAVITLCEEEACPVYLGQAIRLHWGFPDPAAANGSAAQRLDSFREVRDTLRERLAHLFDGWPAEKG